jgi:hypothetical protein
MNVLFKLHSAANNSPLAHANERSSARCTSRWQRPSSIHAKHNALAV